MTPYFLFLAFACLAISICAFRVQVKDALHEDTSELTDSKSSTGIIIYMAAAGAFSGGGSVGLSGGGFSGGYYGGDYRRTYTPRAPPKWTQLPIGCNHIFNKGLCETVLLQRACEAKHPNHTSEVSAEAACDMIWPKKVLTFGSGREPYNLYCSAAAADTSLQAQAHELMEVVPEDVDWCRVSNMEHLQYRSHSWANTPSDRIRSADSLSLLYYDRQRDKSVGSKLINAVQHYCRKHIIAEPNFAEYGFCRNPTREAQDCDFFWGLREKWNENYGEVYCNSLAEAGRLRCLAFRKQIIRVAQARSSFSTAKFQKFDGVFRMKRSKFQNCPVPVDAPPEPDNSDGEIEQVEHRDQYLK